MSNVLTNVMKDVVKVSDVTGVADALDVLSDEALLERVDELTRRERRITFNVLLHLAEIERRGIHHSEGHESMFAYCTQRLGYSESAAYRRIKSYRCIRDFPDVGVLLRKSRLTICTVTILARVLTRKNCDQLLRAAAGKSQREVRELVAGYQSGPPIRERIRPVVVSRPAAPLALDSVAGEDPAGAAGPAPATVSPAPVSAADRLTSSAKELGQNHLRSEGKNDPVSDKGAGHGTPNSDESVATGPADRETYYEFTIAADDEFMQMYRRVRCILSTKSNPGEDIASVFKLMMREYVKRHAPEEKQTRRQKRAERRAQTGAAAVKPPQKDETCRGRSGAAVVVHDDRLGEAAAPDPATSKAARGASGEPQTRHIPAPVKDQVRLRDRHQCAYVGPDGTRCGSTRHLQFDHIVPFARGGAHAPDNLRLLCAAHNRLEAKGAFGVRATRSRDG